MNHAQDHPGGCRNGSSFGRQRAIRVALLPDRERYFAAKSAMDQAIRVLITEDLPDDAELEAHVLRKAGFDIISIRVETEQDFRHQLDSFNPDLLLSDFSVPGFSGMSALKIARQKRPDIPFIFVSGTIGEE